MRSASRTLVVAFVILIVAGFLQPLPAQERVVVEERSAVVLKKVANTVILRNDKGEIKQYTALPEGATLYIDGEPADFEDLRVGMKLHAVRFEDVPPPTIVTPAAAREMGLPETPAPPVESAPTRTTPARTPAPAAEQAAAPAAEQVAELPSTASIWPLVALVGIALLLAGLGLGVVGRRARA